MDYAADLQGAIGYMSQRALRKEPGAAAAAHRDCRTQALVDRSDPAFDRPAKPIGSVMDEATAQRRAAELGWVAGGFRRGWRRVVPSPLPWGIVEIDEIAHLVQAGYVVIGLRRRRHPGGRGRSRRSSAGRRGGDRQGSRLEHAGGELNAADLLADLDQVARVAINFGRPEQRWLERLTRRSAQAYLAEGHRRRCWPEDPCDRRLSRSMSPRPDHRSAEHRRALVGWAGTRRHSATAGQLQPYRSRYCLTIGAMAHVVQRAQRAGRYHRALPDGVASRLRRHLERAVPNRAGAHRPAARRADRRAEGCAEMRIRPRASRASSASCVRRARGRRNDEQRRYPA